MVQGGSDRSDSRCDHCRLCAGSMAERLACAEQPAAARLRERNGMERYCDARAERR